MHNTAQPRDEELERGGGACSDLPQGFDVRVEQTNVLPACVAGELGAMAFDMTKKKGEGPKMKNSA